MRGLVGSTMRVLVDRVEEGTAIGRSEGDAPDIDCVVRLEGGAVAPGEFVDARITGTDGYDLKAAVVAPAETGP